MKNWVFKVSSIADVSRVLRFPDTGDIPSFSSIKLNNEEAAEHLTEKRLEILWERTYQKMEVVIRIYLSNINFDFT